MLQPTAAVSQRFSDVNRRTMRVIEIISAWVVNTFYNYLHQTAVELHTNGRVGSITDGYRHMVKQYLDSFNTVEGYKRLIISLHKYYVDNSNCSGIAFDEWTHEVLEQFVPLDYKAIMSNEQQDTLLRNVLIHSIRQFSNSVVCTKLLDLLISNHDEPSIAPQMKSAMKASLLAERQKIFNNIHRASTGSDSGPQMTMKREICTLIEENVVLKNKNVKLASSLQKSLEGMKMRDKTILMLKNQVVELQKQREQLHARVPMGDIYVQPRTPAEEFKSSMADIAFTSNLRAKQNQPTNEAPLRPILKLPPSILSGQNDIQPSVLPEYMARSNQSTGNMRITQQISEPIALPLSNLESPPEPFEQADEEPEPNDIASIPSEPSSPITGNDTVALDMDEFMNS